MIINDYKVFETKFIYKKVSFIYKCIFQCEFIMIGVHMSFESQKDRVQFKIEYDLDHEHDIELWIRKLITV